MLGPADYDSSAASYAATIDERPWSPLYERPATLGLLPDVKEKDVLDAGCGHGWYADWLARIGARVVAVDCSHQMVDLANERLKGRALVIRGDASETFDVIVSSLVIHYLTNLAK